MVIKLIMEAIKAVILFVIGLFPTLPTLDFVPKWVETFFEMLLYINRFVSLPVLGLCLTAIFVCYNLRLIWSIIMWVVRKIPGVS